MKKSIKYLLVLSLSIFLLSGCAGSNQPTLNNSKEEVKMTDFSVETEDYENGIIKISVTQNVEYNQFESILKGSAYAIHLAFKQVLVASDKKYFMVLNKGISNLDGFPINNMKDFSDYMIRDWKNEGEAYGTAQKIYLKVGNTIRTNTYQLFILPLDKQDNFFSSWSRAELEKYYKNTNL